MDNKTLGALFALLFSLTVGVIATGFANGAHELYSRISGDYEPSLARELVEIKTTTVSCGTSATQIAPGAGTRSFMVVNTSATAVYVGGSDVDGSTAGTTGIDVCDGCTAGKTLSMDAREAYCVVASGSVSVEVVYGVN